MSRPARSILSHFLCLLVLLTGSSGLASGMVLCRDVDGCVAVEAAHAGHGDCHAEGGHDRDRHDSHTDPEQSGGARAAPDAAGGACDDTRGVTTGVTRHVATPDFSRLDLVVFGSPALGGPSYGNMGLRATPGASRVYGDWGPRAGELLSLRGVVLLI